MLPPEKGSSNAQRSNPSTLPGVFRADDTGPRRATQGLCRYRKAYLQMCEMRGRAGLGRQGAIGGSVSWRPLAAVFREIQTQIPAAHRSELELGRVGLSLTRQCLPQCGYNLPVIISAYAEVMPGKRLSLGTLC